MKVEQWVAVVIGIVFLAVVLYLAFKYPKPTPIQYLVMRIMLSLAAACLGVILTGFLTLKTSFGLSAGGALALFVIVYFYSPAALPDMAAWQGLVSDWTNIRDILVDGGNPEDIVKALNSVNRAGTSIREQESMLSDFNSLYGQDFKKMYLKLRDGKIDVPSENSRTDLLLNSGAKWLYEALVSLSKPASDG